MRKLTMLGAAVAMGAFAAQRASAGVMYQYVADAGQYTAPAAGATVPVNVYLKEIASGGSPSLLVADNGLFSGGAEVLRTGSGSAVMTGVNLDTVDFTGPSAVNVGGADTTFNVNTGTSDLKGVGFGNTNGGAVSGTPANEIYLGTVLISAGSGTTSYKLQAVSGGGTTLDFQGNDLDVSSASAPAYTGAGDASVTPFTFTITPTPEPASLGLLGLGALGLLARRRK
jgi:hypothetical protein